MLLNLPELYRIIDLIGLRLGGSGVGCNTQHTVVPIDYRCDDRRFWLPAHNCQVSTPTSQNLELEQQIRIFFPAD